MAQSGRRGKGTPCGGDLMKILDACRWANDYKGASEDIVAVVGQQYQQLQEQGQRLQQRRERLQQQPDDVENDER